MLERLAAGETLALVSDAGTPGVSDPGRLLAAAVAEAGYRVEPIAGPSAVAAILSISGFPAIPFSFLGFPPSRHGERSRWYARFASRDETRILFESPVPHRRLPRGDGAGPGAIRRSASGAS